VTVTWVRVVVMLILVGGFGYLASAALLRGVRSRFGLSHPFWTHAPAMGVFSLATAFFVLLVAAGTGVRVAYINSVNQYPTAGGFLSYFVPIGILAIAVSVLTDELWARGEIRKTFNWMSLLDEGVIGFMLIYAHGSEYHFFGPESGNYTVTIDRDLVALVGSMIVAAALLELFRRPAPRERYLVVKDTTVLEGKLAGRTESGERISYFEGQNPAYLTVLVVVICVALVFGAVMSWRASMPWVALLLMVIAGAGTLVYGGMRVSLTSTILDVRLGMLGIRLLTLPTAEITDVSVCPGGAAEDAATGSGKRDIRSLSFGGHRGVMVGTALGQRYLIGSDRPERLAAVLRAVSAKR